MRVPIESIQYLVDVFIEGGYAEEEDLDHLDSIHMWLREEEQVQRRAFEKRITRDVNPDYRSLVGSENPVSLFPQVSGEQFSPMGCYTLPDGSCQSPSCSLHSGWKTESRPYENPAEMVVNRDGEDGPIDEESLPENRSSFTIVDDDGNQYFFTP